jgi:hypothetical protein
MASGLIFLLFLLAPLILGGINLARVRWRRWNTTRGPKAAEPIRFPRRKARVKPAHGPSNCGRHFTHLVLTLTGSRGSCKHCAGLDAPEPDGEDAVSAAQRIIDEASAKSDQPPASQ